MPSIFEFIGYMPVDLNPFSLFSGVNTFGYDKKISPAVSYIVMVLPFFASIQSLAALL